VAPKLTTMKIKQEKEMRTVLNMWGSKRGLSALGLACVGLATAGVLLVAGPAFGKGQHRQAAGVVAPTVITVTAGKPSELAFKLSKFSNIKPGKITFKVVDSGLAFHDFKICTTPTTGATKNACVGKTTKVLHPKQTATLTVTLTKVGTYEFLCTVTGHAAAGMKGILGVGVAVTKAAEAAAAKGSSTSSSSSASSSSSSGVLTTPSSSSSGTVSSGSSGSTTTTPASSGGTVAADKSQDSSCPNGSTIKQVGAGADGDGDEAGDPTDGDGCL
jgi:uncharacterized cupredoxin-like copper-binding protein